MTKYDILFLIISCGKKNDQSEQHKNQLELDSKMKIIAKKYLSLYTNRVKYFFIELEESLPFDVYEDGDHLYFKGIDSTIPGIYLKTIKAINYLHPRYDYDFIIRTNLSSFWNIPNTLEYFTRLPKNNYFGGICLWNTFISGSGLVMSRDLGLKISDAYVDTNEIHDDVAISNVVKFTLNEKLSPFEDFRIHYLTDQEGNHIPDDLSKILYFRIRNNRDRNIDIELMKILLQRIYNISS